MHAAWLFQPRCPCFGSGRRWSGLTFVTCPRTARRGRTWSSIGPGLIVALPRQSSCETCLRASWREASAAARPAPRSVARTRTARRTPFRRSVWRLKRMPSRTCLFGSRSDSQPGCTSRSSGFGHLTDYNWSSDGRQNLNQGKRSYWSKIASWTPPDGWREGEHCERRRISAAVGRPCIGRPSRCHWRTEPAARNVLRALEALERSDESHGVAARGST